MPIFYISVLNDTDTEYLITPLYIMELLGVFFGFFPQMFSYLNNSPQYVPLEHGQLSEVSLRYKHKSNKTVIHIHAQPVSQYVCYKSELSTPTCYR